jgi:hypothetical protein
LRACFEDDWNAAQLYARSDGGFRYAPEVFARGLPSTGRQQPEDKGEPIGRCRAASAAFASGIGLSFGGVVALADIDLSVAKARSAPSSARTAPARAR